MKRVFGKGRYANVTSTMALIVALGGTSYAAVTLPANSVGSKQIKKNGVARSDIRSNAVSSSKVKDGTLLSTDFKAGQIPAGPAGPKGATGATGATGAPGATGARGPSDAFSARGTNILNFASPASTPTTVVSVALPAGKYVVNAKVLANNSEATVREYRCELKLGATVIDFLGTTGLDIQGVSTDDRSVATLTGAGTLAAAGTADLVCLVSGTTGNWLARSMTAIQVATLNGA